MRIECISVCVGYDDFLAVTARHNRGLFDRWIVVTTPKDRATQEICRKFNLDMLITDEITGDGEFNKGRGIQRAQRLCAIGSWRLHLDADMILPTTFRNSLDAANLDTNKIYGCDRVMVKGWQAWQNLYNSGYLGHQWDYHCRVCFPSGVELGSRWCSPQFGYVPIGAFQLWHSDADEFISFQHKSYPSRHGNSSRTDTQMGLMWDRRRRELLPEIIAVHLESEEGGSKMGVNWSGRTTKRFGPDKPESVELGYK